MNRHNLRATLLISLLCLSLLFTGCTNTSSSAKPAGEPSKSPASTSDISPTQAPIKDSEKKPAGTIAYKHVLNLVYGIGSRQEGTPSTAIAAMYINGELKTLGYEPVRQGFSAKVKRNEEFVDIKSENIIAEKKGTGEKVLVIGAHYDSVDLGEGADDNASGIGVLLELATRLKNVETPYTIRFIAFGDEEDGLTGSEYYVSTLKKEELKNIVGMINLDTLMSGNKLYVYGDFGIKGVLRDAALKAAKELKIDLITQPGTKEYPKGTTGPFSDQAPFEKVGIPYTYFESTDWTLGEKDGYTQVDQKYGADGEIWHSKFDTLDYINKTFPGRAESHLKDFVSILMKILPEYHP